MDEKQLRNGREEGRVGGCVIQQNPPPAYLPWGLEGSAPNSLFAEPKSDMGRRVVERDTAERTKPG